MPILNPDLINSCRVCQSPNQDGDYQCLYQTYRTHEGNQVLSEAGILYENLLNISLNTQSYYPQFLCNSCDLQMKLFKKLKDKAYKTLEYLQNLNDKDIALADYDYIKNEPEDCIYEDQNQQVEADEYEDNELENKTICEENIDEADEFPACEENIAFSEIPEKKLQENIYAFDEDKPNYFYTHGEYKSDRESSYTEAEMSHIYTAQQVETENGSLASNYILKIEPTADVHGSLNSYTLNAKNLKMNTEQIIDNNDFVTEIRELIDDENKMDSISDIDENIVEYDIYTENKPCVSSFNYNECMLEENIDNIQKDENNRIIENTNVKRRLNKGCKSNVVSFPRKRKYKCIPCQLEFDNLQEHKSHRTEFHNEKYPCNLCYKELKSPAALHHHMKLHNDQPAYQCEICQKTFNQKVHYQYHMNGHNNIRNYKCNLCEKAFISKADLKIHLRLHTGLRPYVCNICGKDYLMMEHLKTHLLSHTEQYFQCDICSKKFTTHKNLRLHVRTIHTDEPQFKCNFCMKPFRRKHHLEYHLKLHQREENFLNSGYEMIDDTEVESNEMDLIDVCEQEVVDDPGFIALNDEIM